MRKYTIGFIDEEEQQRVNFKNYFEDDFVVKLIDTDKSESANELLEYSLKEGVNILLIDYDMSEKLGYNADTIENEIKSINPHFPFLIITSEIVEAFDHISNPGIVYSKSIWNGDNKNELVDFKLKIKKIIEKYEILLKDYEHKLQELYKKLSDTGLSPDEENMYVKINTYLSETKSDFTSPSFFSQSTNTKLDVIIEKTEALLVKLGKNA